MRISALVMMLLVGGWAGLAGADGGSAPTVVPTPTPAHAPAPAPVREVAPRPAQTVEQAALEVAAGAAAGTAAEAAPVAVAAVAFTFSDAVICPVVLVRAEVTALQMDGDKGTKYAAECRIEQVYGGEAAAGDRFISHELESTDHANSWLNLNKPAIGDVGIWPLGERPCGVGQSDGHDWTSSVEYAGPEGGLARVAFPTRWPYTGDMPAFRGSEPARYARLQALAEAIHGVLERPLESREAALRELALSATPEIAAYAIATLALDPAHGEADLRELIGKNLPPISRMALDLGLVERAGTAWFNSAEHHAYLLDTIRAATDVEGLTAIGRYLQSLQSADWELHQSRSMDWVYDVVNVGMNNPKLDPQFRSSYQFYIISCPRAKLDQDDAIFDTLCAMAAPDAASAKQAEELAGFLTWGFSPSAERDVKLRALAAKWQNDGTVQYILGAYSVDGPHPPYEDGERFGMALQLGRGVYEIKITGVTEPVADDPDSPNFQEVAHCTARYECVRRLRAGKEAFADAGEFEVHTGPLGAGHAQDNEWYWYVWRHAAPRVGDRVVIVYGNQAKDRGNGPGCASWDPILAFNLTRQGEAGKAKLAAIEAIVAHFASGAEGWKPAELDRLLALPRPAFAYGYLVGALEYASVPLEGPVPAAVRNPPICAVLARMAKQPGMLATASHDLGNLCWDDPELLEAYRDALVDRVLHGSAGDEESALFNLVDMTRRANGAAVVGKLGAEPAVAVLAKLQAFPWKDRWMDEEDPVWEPLKAALKR